MGKKISSMFQKANRIGNLRGYDFNVILPIKRAININTMAPNTQNIVKLYALYFDTKILVLVFQSLVLSLGGH